MTPAYEKATEARLAPSTMKVRMLSGNVDLGHRRAIPGEILELPIWHASALLANSAAIIVYDEGAAP